MIWWPSVEIGVTDTLSRRPPMDPLVAPTFLLPHPLQTWTPFWWNSLSSCTSLQLSLTLTTPTCANLPNFLGLLTPFFALFMSSLLPCWPDKFIQMPLCNYSSLKGVDSASFSWNKCIPLSLVPSLVPGSLLIGCLIVFGGQNSMLLLVNTFFPMIFARKPKIPHPCPLVCCTHCQFAHRDLLLGA